MARGVSLRQLISDLRDELRRANSPAAGVDDVASLRRTINHVYRVLYYTNDWPFLNTQFEPIPLVAGQRHYDFPEGLDPDRVLKATVKWSSDALPVERGISDADYNAYDSEDNERTSPIEKWDVRFTGDREQIEVWPLPDGTTQSLRFFGTYAMAELVNDTDKCRLESEVVVLYAAAELLPKDSPDKEAKLELAKELLRQIKVRGNSGAGKVYRMGLDGDPSQKVHPRAQVRISG